MWTDRFLSLIQWFDIKWRCGRRHEIIEEVGEHAAIRVRSGKPKNLALPQNRTIWSMRSALQAMREWTTEMSQDMFTRGSVVERFTYVYGLYMISGWADEEYQWCKDAVKDTVEWMSRLMWVTIFSQYYVIAHNLTRQCIAFLMSPTYCRCGLHF